MRPQYQESVTEMDPVEAEMQLREWARENVIERMLLRQQALADPEPVPPEAVAEGLERVRSDAVGQIGCGTRTTDEEVRSQVELEYRMQRLVARIHSEVKRPAEKAIAAYYKKHRDEFRTPEMLWAKHVVRNVDEQHSEDEARAAIEQALAELRNGSTFEDVADRYSDCAGRGGDLGWFPRGEMVEEFEDAVFPLGVGAMTPVFRTVFGFHIAKVYGRKPAGIRPLPDVREQIAGALISAEQRQAIERYLDRLREAADIRQARASA